MPPSDEVSHAISLAAAEGRESSLATSTPAFRNLSSYSPLIGSE